jgi:hypothetical protein
MGRAFAGEWCAVALGNTPEQRFLGEWSDDVPVTEAIVTDDPAEPVGNEREGVASRITWQSRRRASKGARRPTLAAVAADPDTVWTALTVAPWYGAGPRLVKVASATAVRYHSGLPPVPLRWVLIRDPQGRFTTQALLCTDSDADPAQILAWFIQRWQLEVTFEEARRHLGVETQRQWSTTAIRRTTPVLLGLFSLVTLLVHRQMSGPGAVVRQATWYRKRDPTFADALALVRRDLWQHQAFSTSPCADEMVKVPRRSPCARQPGRCAPASRSPRPAAVAAAPPAPPCPRRRWPASTVSPYPRPPRRGRPSAPR